MAVVNINVHVSEGDEFTHKVHGKAYAVLYVGGQAMFFNELETLERFLDMVVYAKEDWEKAKKGAVTTS